ncbi:MAG: crotonase/enoyl-CoA hydratase family protein [Deltaproteobacteria bacterium]|nr:MAG: crotonase/enoyl-CoA hydratase family protein [Deltaproteobacteria bacterium]
MTEALATLTTEAQGHVWLMGLNRATKRNAFNLQMLSELARAMTEYEERDDLRCAVLFAHGDHFTAGLDLAEVGPAVKGGQPLFPADSVDPLGLYGKVRSKPLVIAVQGWCLTIGIELSLAADIRVAASDTKFGQIEIKRGIFPFGGATLRMPQMTGWGNAMRYLLTGDTFDAEEAFRIGMVQEVTKPGQQLERALAIAQTIAQQAPLGVQATLASSRTTLEQGPQQAAQDLLSQAMTLMETEDALEGLMSFVERREAKFQGN